MEGRFLGGAGVLRGVLVLGMVLVCAGDGVAARVGGGRELEGAARWLEGQGLRYGAMWVPPGEERAWKMDCSNAARWLYREWRGVALPRTASGQYEFVRERGRLRRMRPDARRLARELRPGDLLFWEHTYRPVRRPPVTHVMVYLGRDREGRMWMAGAQGKGGVGVHEFRPRMRMGGYRVFLWWRREGRFVGYGRL